MLVDESPNIAFKRGAPLNFTLGVEVTVRGLRYSGVLQRIQPHAEAISKETGLAENHGARLRSDLVRIEDLFGMGLANVK